MATATKRPRRASPSASAAPTPDVARTVLEMEQRAQQDFAWACEHLLWIKPKQTPAQRLTLKWPQRYMLEKILQPTWDRGEPLGLVILKSRRVGISTACAAWLYHKVRWWPGQSAMITAHRDDTVDELHQMVQRFHNNLPPELRPATHRFGRKELTYPPPLEGSIRVLPAGYIDIAKGKTLQHFHGSEMPEWGDPETIMAGVSEAVPDHGRTSLILESTALREGDWFHQFWQGVGRGETSAWGRRRWRRLFLPWYADPDHQHPVPLGWEPTDEEREMQRRFRLRDEQLVWFRAKRAEQELLHPGQGRQYMAMNYPSTSEEAFVAAGGGIFVQEWLDLQRAYQRSPIAGFDLVRTGPWTTSLRPAKPADAALLIWEMPQAGCQYALGVDVSEGLGQDGSAVVVLRMPGFVQVAEWLDYHTSTAQLAGVVAAIARLYAQLGDRPVVNVEVTGPGIDTNSRLQDIYSGDPLQLYIWEPFDRLGTPTVTAASKTGWVTSHLSKQVLVATANSLLTEGLCQIPSMRMLADLRRVKEEQLGYYSTGGCDLAVAWLLATMAAWRKIARYALPGLQIPTMPDGRPPEPSEPWRQDTKWEHIMAQRSDWSARVGNEQVEWRFQ